MNLLRQYTQRVEDSIDDDDSFFFKRRAWRIYPGIMPAGALVDYFMKAVGSMFCWRLRH